MGLYGLGLFFAGDLALGENGAGADFFLTGDAKKNRLSSALGDLISTD